MMSSSSVISEIFKPCAPSSPISRVDTSSETPAGNSVISGASSERKITSSSKMMKMNENSWVLLPVRCELTWLATLVATWPASLSASPGGGRAATSTPSRLLISVFWWVMSA
jgi:hypothetical protein